jgi:hypothetical protein
MHVIVTPTQLKVCSGLRMPLPFERPFRLVQQDGSTLVSTANIVCQADVPEATAEQGLKDAALSSCFISKVAEVQVLQGFAWRKRAWRYESSLASGVRTAWSLRSQVKRGKFARPLVELWGTCENILWQYVQISLLCVPSVLLICGLVLMQMCGLAHDPAYMMQRNDASWMASQWVIDPAAYPSGYQRIPVWVALATSYLHSSSWATCFTGSMVCRGCAWSRAGFRDLSS